MKLVKIVTLAMLLNGITQTATAAIEHVNTQRVQAAYDAYTYESSWAPTVRYVAFGTLTAAVAYGLYTWLRRPVLNADAQKTIENLSAEECKNLVQAAALILQQERDRLTQNAINASKEAENLPFLQRTLTSASNIASAVGSAASSTLTYGFGVAGATTLSSYAYGAVSPYLPTIPTAGSLTWYITARTDYDRNVMDIQRYLKHSRVFQNEVNDVMQLIVFDTEKIVAYLKHFDTYLANQTYVKIGMIDYVRKTNERYTHNIIALTNELVDALNEQEDVASIVEKLVLVLSEVNSAKMFVNAYYR